MQLRETVSISQVVDVLNDAFIADPEAMETLVNTRVSCNIALANHPTIQVVANKEMTEFKVGLLGVLNGLFGVAPDGMGAIASYHEVKCSNNCNVDESARVGDTCRECGENLTCGKLLGFGQIRPKNDIGEGVE